MSRKVIEAALRSADSGELEKPPTPQPQKEPSYEVKQPVVPPPEPRKETESISRSSENIPLHQAITPSVPGDPGRGGAQHTAVQGRLKRAAENLGFHATIEKAVPQGSVDLALQKGDRSIACEISFTTTIDHEVGLVINRLKAGFKSIAIICTEESRLTKIKKAVLGCLPVEEASCVEYFLPESFITYLEELVKKEKATPLEPQLRLGKYKVKTTQVALTEEERKRKEQQMVTMIAETMKKPKKPKK